jgi:hypothetical protein
VVYQPEVRGYANDRMIRLAKEMAVGLVRPDGRPNPKKLEKLVAVVDRLQMTADKRYHYLQFFLDRVTDERIFCDITPAYALLDADGFAAIDTMHPDIRYVFLLRDPIDRFWSALRMGVRKMEGFDPVKRFEEMLDHPEHFGRSDYGRTIDELEKVVPADRVLYVFYEDLFRQESVDGIADFLGIDRMPAKFDMVVNPSAKIDLPADSHRVAMAKFRHVYDYAFDRFGDAVPSRWRTSLATAT